MRQGAVGQFIAASGHHVERVRAVHALELVAGFGVGARQRAEREQPRHKAQVGVRFARGDELIDLVELREVSRLPALREAGRISSPAFRIGVVVPSATWIPGRTRRPVPGVGGLWIGDARRYPVFSARDRRRIAFGPESTHRPGGIDDAWHKSADAAGVVILDTEAVDRDGKRGWIVVPAAAAKAIRKATK